MIELCTVRGLGKNLTGSTGQSRTFVPDQGAGIDVTCCHGYRIMYIYEVALWSSELLHLKIEVQSGPETPLCRKLFLSSLATFSLPSLQSYSTFYPAFYHSPLLLYPKIATFPSNQKQQ